MRIVLSLLVALLLTISVTYAIPVPFAYGGTANIASGAQRIFIDSGTGTHQFHRVCVWTSTGASVINLNFNVGATGANTDPAIQSGASFNYGFTDPPSPATNQFNYFGAGTTGTVNWMAW